MAPSHQPGSSELKILQMVHNSLYRLAHYWYTINNYIYPFILQSGNSDDSNCVLYKRGPSTSIYYALCLKSTTNQYFYILPTKVDEPLTIHSTDQLKTELRDKDVYVFMDTTVRCSNPRGACQLQRLTKK